MRLMILIKTPKGYAKSTERKLRPFIIGRKKKCNEILTTEDDNKILWVVESNHKDYIRITKNVAMYDKLINMVLDRKDIRRLARLSKDQEQELNEMLKDQTTIDIVNTKEQEKIKQEFLSKA